MTEQQTRYLPCYDEDGARLHWLDVALVERVE